MDKTADIKTIIAEDVEITGSIKCTSDIQIDGKLNGDMACTGNSTIGTTANVKGSISVESVTVLGQVNGNINAKDKIELQSSARLHGDIRAKRLTVQDGVTFVGKCEVNASGVPASRPSASEQQGSVLDSADTDKDVDKEEPKGKSVFGRK